MVGVGVVATAVAALRLLWASRDWPLVHDAPLMHYVAWRIQDGAAPYRDLFDMNFPGVYVTHLLLLRTLGPGDHAFRVFDVGLLAATGAGLWAALRRCGPWAGPAAAALFALYHVAGGPWLAGQRDLMLCALLAWGTAAAIAAGVRDGDRARALDRLPRPWRWGWPSGSSLTPGCWRRRSPGGRGAARCGGAASRPS